MSPRAPILAIAGLVLMAFGLISHLMTRQPADSFFSFGWYSLGHLLLGAAALAVYATSGSTSSVNNFLRQRSTRYGANAITYSLLFVLVLVMGNFMAARYHGRIDLSASGVNSLSEQSREVVGALEEDVIIEAYLQGGSDPVLGELLAAYRYENDHLSYSIIDPQLRPELAQKSAVTQVPSLRIVYGDRSTLVTKTDEATITNGIHSLAGGERKKIYFVEGHGEPDSNDPRGPGGTGQFKQELVNQNYDVASLFLPELGAVPDDADVLIILSASKDWFPREFELLSAYMKNGGRLLVALEPRRDSGLADFLAEWGVTVGDDVIVDQQVRMFQGMSLGLDPVVARYGKHPAVASMKERTLFSLARSVTPSPSPREGLVVEPLAFTSDTSWAETDLDTLFDSSEAKLQDADIKGPVVVATAVSAFAEAIGGEGEGEFQMVVLGDASLLTNQFFRQLFNDALVLSATGWLAGESQLISIPPRGVRASRAHLTAKEGRNVFYLSVLLLPELILMMGIVVWWRRTSL